MEKTETQENKVNDEIRSPARLWWLLTTAFAIAIVLGLGTLEAIRLLALPLAVLTFGITLATALAPMVSWLERRMPRLLAILLVYMVMLIVIVGLVWAVIPSLVAQLADLGSRLPDWADHAQEFINNWRGNLPGNSFTDSLLSQLSKLGPTLLSLPVTITSSIFSILLIIFISFYMLSEASTMQHFLLSMFPRERHSHILAVSVSMAQAMGGYIRGVVINGAIVGFLTFLGLLILHIDFAVAFGVMAGLLELLPVVGPIVSAIIIVGLTLLQSPGQALAALIFMIVMQQVENNVLVPHIMRSQTDVSPLLSILALFAGGAIGGLMGAVIAIPVAAALRVLVRQVLAPAVRKQTGAESVNTDS